MEREEYLKYARDHNLMIGKSLRPPYSDLVNEDGSFDVDLFEFTYPSVLGFYAASIDYCLKDLDDRVVYEESVAKAMGNDHAVAVARIMYNASKLEF